MTKKPTAAISSQDPRMLPSLSIADSCRCRVLSMSSDADVQVERLRRTMARWPPNRISLEMLKLVIGNKNYSSWSMRPWLALRANNIPFEEVFIPLYTDQADKDRILSVSHSGKVPALIDGDVTVWDSLAIIEYLAEKFPQAKLWPEDRARRAHARSISAEMHSGFMP